MIVVKEIITKPNHQNYQTIVIEDSHIAHNPCPYKTSPNQITHVCVHVSYRELLTS